MGNYEMDEWARNRGLVKTNTTICLATVAGVKCENHTNHLRICISGISINPVKYFDHSRLWYLPNSGRTRAEREYVLTAEAISTADEYITLLAAELSSLGLRVDVSESSPYYPGRNTMIVVTKDDASRNYAERCPDDRW